ncbi:hypothetical protein ONZ45_g134 [Pleurotus djamor]|nr:hypothetical protein ONZ45_g134 [Pleurotus djamor]
MKYVALLSGGKDSCFNLLHCHKNGHELVAAASLGPGPGKDELDSFMYQTVGQDAIEYVAKALDVPLFRRVISGSAVEQSLEYGTRRVRSLEAISGDETEDLLELLSTVKTQHPDIQGVSVGAILSNYQRRDQSELLTEMIEAGMEVVLIKVAGIGLKPAHLGLNLSEMRPTLLRLNTLYGSHVCGEGGEYESLTLDCPLFKQRITLEETETVIHSDNDFATVAYLRIKRARLDEKDRDNNFDLEIPPVLQNKSQSVAEALRQYDQVQSQDPAPSLLSQPTSSIPVAASHSVNSWVSISNIQVTDWPVASEFSVEDEVKACFGLLQDKLAECSLDFGHCTHINIFLASMDLFVKVNAIYGSFFSVSPPSRACVAVDLPSPNRVRLDCTACQEKSPRDRTALHVQGLSYWAPANIGPYSQAVISDNHIFISGQIGLIPSSLMLPSPPSLSMEFALSCQHVKRVITALRENSNWTGCLCTGIYWLARSHDMPSVKAGDASWRNEARSPVIFVTVKELPKAAMVEKQVLYHTGRFTVLDEDGEEVTESSNPIFEQGDEVCGTQVWHWELSYYQPEPSGSKRSQLLLVYIRGQSEQIPSSLAQLFQSVSGCLLSTRVFQARQNHTLENPQCREWCPSPTYIPCRSISSAEADDWDLAILVMGV